MYSVLRTMSDNHSESVQDHSSVSTVLPTLDELKKTFPDHDSALCEILRITRDYLLLQSNFSHLQSSFEEISHEHALILAEKDKLELLRKQLKEEAQGILKDAQVLRIRNEQIRASRTNSRDELDNINLSSNNIDGRSSACASPSGVGTPTSKNKITFTAKKSFHVSTATQTDNIPAQAKPYVTVRERMIARGEQDDNSAHQSLAVPTINSNNPADEGDETAFQATTFQDFVRMRREIVDLRNKVAQLQPQLSPQTMHQYLSPRTVTSNPSTERMHHSPRGYNNNANSNNKASSRSVPSQPQQNHHHHIHTHQTAGGTIRMVSESASQPTISPTNASIHSSYSSINKSLPNLKSTPHGTSTESPVQQANTLSMIGQFLPKLSI